MSLSETGEKWERGEVPRKGDSDGGSVGLLSSSSRIAAIFSEKKTLKRAGSLSRGTLKGKIVDSPCFPNNSSAI